MKRHCLLLIFSMLLAKIAATTSPLPNQPGLAVNKIWLYPDTNLATQTNQLLEAGSLVQIIGQSATEQLDRDQNQQFFWYKIETRDGRTGWVFGDGLAVQHAPERLPDFLKNWQRKPVSLGAGFEDAQFWLAAIEGHDSKEYQHEFYGEYYWVATNAAGRSIFLRYGGRNAEGETVLKQLILHDLTADQRPEIALETSIRERGSDSETRILEIHSLQNGSLRRIFSEKLSLLDRQGLPSPALLKSVELENQTIRVEYLDFFQCKKPDAPADEDCLEFVTYTYSWNARTSQFELLYEPTRLLPEAAAATFGIAIRLEPNKLGTAVALLGEGERVRVLQVLDKIWVEKGEKRVETFLFVKNQYGYMGYAPASKFNWLKTRHAEVLKKYCSLPPLVRTVWRFDFAAVRLVSAGGQQARQ